MNSLSEIITQDMIDITTHLVVALVAGALIGIERSYHGRPAGFRTHVLVCLASALLMLVTTYQSHWFPGSEADIVRIDPTRMAQGIMTGIGFLGAGVIMKEGMNVRGLNTAATLWSSAAVGACAGADLAAQAAALTLFVIAGNTLLRPLVNAINRIPFDERSSEATYSVRVTAGSAAADRLRDQLAERLEQADYPVAEVEVDTAEHTDDKVEIVATLVSTAIEPKELDEVVADLRRRPGVDYASWETSTKD